MKVCASKVVSCSLWNQNYWFVHLFVIYAHRAQIMITDIHCTYFGIFVHFIGLSFSKDLYLTTQKAHNLDFTWNPPENLINQIIQEKLFSFMECSGKAMSHHSTWNLPDFMKSAMKDQLPGMVRPMFLVLLQIRSRYPHPTPLPCKRKLWLTDETVKQKVFVIFKWVQTDLWKRIFPVSHQTGLYLKSYENEMEKVIFNTFWGSKTILILFNIFWKFFQKIRNKKTRYRFQLSCPIRLKVLLTERPISIANFCCEINLEV